jgi:hypothetical protein
VERIVLKHVPKTSRHVPNTFPKIIQFPKLWGSMSQTCPKRQTFQSCPKLCLKGIPKIVGSQSVPELAPKPFPKPFFPKHVTSALPKDVPNNDVQSDTVSRSGPRGSNSNMVQRSRNNNGIACTHRAFNNTARAKYYCWGIYTGDTPKLVRWEKASEFGFGYKARACLCIAQSRRA